jgi:hypothetical protein
MISPVSGPKLLHSVRLSARDRIDALGEFCRKALAGRASAQTVIHSGIDTIDRATRAPGEPRAVRILDRGMYSSTDQGGRMILG